MMMMTVTVKMRWETGDNMMMMGGCCIGVLCERRWLRERRRRVRVKAAFVHVLHTHTHTHTHVETSLHKPR